MDEALGLGRVAGLTGKRGWEQGPANIRIPHAVQFIKKNSRNRRSRVMGCGLQWVISSKIEELVCELRSERFGRSTL